MATDPRICRMKSKNSAEYMSFSNEDFLLSSKTFLKISLGASLSAPWRYGTDRLNSLDWASYITESWGGSETLSHFATIYTQLLLPWDKLFRVSLIELCGNKIVSFESRFVMLKLPSGSVDVLSRVNTSFNYLITSSTTYSDFLRTRLGSSSESCLSISLIF